MKKSKTGLAVVVYAAILIILGALGYHSGSQISGYLGVGFGAALLGCASLIFKRVRIGLHASLIISLLLTIVFSIRYMATGKQLTAGLAVLSAGMLLLLLAKAVQWRKS